MSTCANTRGSFACACKKGYIGDGMIREDINECSTDSHSCNDHADCENTDGGYTCTCVEGYYGDGNSCLNINECKNGSHD